MTDLPFPAVAEAKCPLEPAQSTASGGTTPWFPAWASSEQPVSVAASVPSYVLPAAMIDAVTLRLSMVACVAAVPLVSS